MDNLSVRVVSEGEKALYHAIALAMHKWKSVVAWGEWNNGLVLFWTSEVSESEMVGIDVCKFLSPLSAAEAASAVHKWFEENRDKESGKYVGGDVENGHGFLLETNGWGHAFDAVETEAHPRGRTWTYGVCFIRPVASWYGK